MAYTVVKKSTIVRPVVPTALATLEVVAPRIGAAWVERIWFRVRRATPLVEPTGEQFEVVSHGHTVRGQVWGRGPVVYLVHGWEGNADQMLGLVQPLVAAGFRVVAHDAPSHGRSEPGAHGATSTDAVEIGQALDAVVARFGPARAIVAHSLGSIATLLAIRDGWVSTRQLVLVAPTQGVPHWVRVFRRQLGFGDRTQHHLEQRIERRTGYPVDDLDIRSLAVAAHGLSTLVVQDDDDRQLAHSSAAFLAATVTRARLMRTRGLGHNRVLADPSVAAAVTAFVATGEVLESHAVA
jgi:pimeloyl-ACP methyl ester carboxylesterase